jgi:hypothetical protein
MSHPADDMASPHSVSSRLLRSSLWGWFFVVLCFGAPLSWIGWKCYIGSQIRLGKNGFGNIERARHQAWLQPGRHPAWLRRWISPALLEAFRPVIWAKLTSQKGDADAGLRWLQWEPQVTALEYHGPLHTNRTCELIVECCPRLERLNLHEVDLSANDCQQLSRLTSLRSLELRCNVADGGMSHLATLPNLRTLRFFGSPGRVSANTLHGIAELDHVEMMELGTTDIDLRVLLMPRSDGTPVLPSLKHLTIRPYLTIRPSAMISASLSKFTAPPKLTHLTLSRTKVDDSGLSQLESLTNLRQLYLAHCPITDEGCKSLAKLTNLESLHLGATQITIDGVRQLSGLRHLRQLTIKQCYKIRDPSEIDSLPKSFLSRCRVVR